MEDEDIKAAYRAEDARRFQRDPCFQPDIVGLCNGIQRLRPGQIIKMKCYNRVDMEMIRDQLTPEERKLVVFSWLTWGGR